MDVNIRLPRCGFAAIAPVTILEHHVERVGWLVKFDAARSALEASIVVKI
jgi:hypothetical protein